MAAYAPGFIPTYGKRRYSVTDMDTDEPSAKRARILRRDIAQAPFILARAPAAPLRGFVGASGEAKYIDVASASYACDTTGSITHISIVPTGTTVSTRDGRKFRVSGMRIRGSLVAGSTTAYAGSMIMLVWDKQPNKALPAVADILDSASSDSFPKRENSQRFMIIRSWRHMLIGANDDEPTGTAKSAYDIDHYVKMPADPKKGGPLIAECTSADTTGAIGNRVTGALYLVTVGNAATTYAANLTATIRTNFMDV